MQEISRGDEAPDFRADSTQGKISLKDYRGKNLVLYFYVKDQTPGCTMQSCSLRDGIEKLKAHNAEVLGISVDGLDSHNKFAFKYNLNFPLVADPDFKISKAYNVFNEERQMSRRVTFLIDKNGMITHIFPKVDVQAHAEEVVEVLKSIK
ncbi:MAG: peroxiredoxin [Nitrososphaerales archaeon]